MSLTEEQAATLSPDSLVVAAGRPPRTRDEPVNPPLVLSSTYFGTGPLGDGDRGYGRYSNPTWDPFEEALGQLEGAELPGLLYASGLAAVSSALSLVPAQGVLVMPSHSYAGSVTMATELAAKGLPRAADGGHRGHRRRTWPRLPRPAGAPPACSGWRAPRTPCSASRTCGP